jgi:hypothetical protein
MTNQEVAARYVSAEELCALYPELFPSQAAIYKLAKADVVPAVRVGRRIRFDLEAIREFIAKGGKALPGGWRMENQSEARR